MMASAKEVNETDKLKKVVKFKTFLEKKIMEAEDDLGNLRTLLDFVNESLLERGFKRVKIQKVEPAQQSQESTTAEETISLKSMSGEILASLLITENSMRVTIPDDKTFSIETPPFHQFLVERVLNKMQEKDQGEAGMGKMTQDRVFNYRLELKDDRIQAIDIQNITTERLRELKSSIRWTLEKMLEKTEEKS